jgi:two-component system, sensor histidine kinase
MRALLEGWGCEVVTTDTAAKALRALRIARRPPDLIIADYHLDAGELGTDAVARLRAALGGTAPGLVITADRMPEALDRIAAAGLQVLNKPVRPHQLRAVVSHLLGAQGRAAGPG